MIEPHSPIPHHSTIENTDAKIWQRLKQGDPQSLEIIYKQNIKVLYLYGRKFSSDQQLIEDCIQEVFMTLWERSVVIGDTDAIKPYLFTSLRRRMIRVTSKNHILIDRNFEIDEYDFNLEFNPEEKLISAEDNREIIKKLSQELNALSKKQQEVVYLKYHCGLNYEEIADVMSINYQSARNLMHKVLTLLRREFLQLLLLLSFLEVE